MGLDRNQKIAKNATAIHEINKRLWDVKTKLIETEDDLDRATRRMNRKSAIMLFFGIILMPIAGGWDVIAQFFLKQYNPGLGPLQWLGMGVGFVAIIFALS